MSDGCPRCKSLARVKSGIVHGMQRWLCKSCGCNYTKSTPRGYQEELEVQAIDGYLEGMSLRKIETLMGISNVTVLRWVRDFKARLLQPFKAMTSPEVQVRKMPLEAAQKLMEKNPPDPRHRWVLVEMPVDEIEGEGIVVIQPAHRHDVAADKKESETKTGS